MDISGFSAEILNNTWTFLDFQQKPKKHVEIFGFSAEIQKNTWNFLDFQQKSKLKLQTLRESRSCNFHANLSASFRTLKFQSGMGSKIQDCPEVCWQNLGSRLKPLEPIEISIGIQDPRSKIAQGSSLGILDLGSWSRLKFQSVQAVSIGIQDSANRPLDNLGGESRQQCL